MKLIYSIVFLFAIFIGNTGALAQNSKYITEEFKVHGVCDNCKKRIENAAYIKGVKQCNWDKKTEVIKVVYNPQKTDLKKIHESIAQAGHTTDEVEATDETYNKLPKCCAYKDGVHKH